MLTITIILSILTVSKLFAVTLKSMMQEFPLWRSMLFVPVNNDRFIEKAHSRGADAIILDLEDSIPLAEKQDARGAVASAAKVVSARGSDVLVRINHEQALTAQDLEAVVIPSVRAIVVPKVSAPEQLKYISELITDLETARDMTTGRMKLIAMIESVEALGCIDAIATASPRLLAMTLGSEDFSASVGMQPTSKGLLFPNQQVLFAARRAGIIALGFAGSIADYSQPDTFRKMITEARQLGFRGAFCIHPSQVAIMNQEFSPTTEEVEQARQILEAYEVALEAGSGVTQYQGKMIDYPVVARAQELLQLHKTIEERKTGN